MLTFFKFNLTEAMHELKRFSRVVNLCAQNSLPVLLCDTQEHPKVYWKLHWIWE